MNKSNKKTYDIDRLSKDELIERIRNCFNNLPSLETERGKDSVLRLIKEYQMRLNGK